MPNKSEVHLFTARTIAIAVATSIVTAAILGFAYVMQNLYIYMNA